MKHRNLGSSLVGKSRRSSHSSNSSESTPSGRSVTGYRDGVLSIQFGTGAVFDYSNVPEEVANKISSAESIGTAFHQMIKGRYPATAQST